MNVRLQPPPQFTGEEYFSIAWIIREAITLHLTDQPDPKQTEQR